METHAPLPLPRLRPTKETPTRAYANHGRWIAECGDRAAVELTPEQKLWQCPLCGCVYVVLWPLNRRAIERLLHPRPIENQNWWPGETLDQLLAENIEHGIAPEPDAA